MTFATLLLAFLAVLGNIPLRTTAEVQALSEKDMRANLPVELTGQIIAAPYSGGLILRDASGGFILQGVPNPAPDLGDIITVHGHTHIDNRNRQGAVQVEKFSVNEQRNPPEARPTDARRVSSGMDNFDLVRLHGFVAEIFKDQNHSDWNYIIVRDDGIPIYVAVPDVGETTVPFHNLIDAEVEIVGVGLPHYGADRMFVGPHIETWSKACIKVVHPALEDPFSSPRLGDIIHVGPSELAKMRRHLVEGNILAVWGGNRFLLLEDTQRLLTIGLADGQALPRPGERVQAVGFPTTDLFRLNLSRALWKTVSTNLMTRSDIPQTVTPFEIFADCRGRHTNAQGDRLLRQTFHGQLIRIRGIVRSLPSYINGNGQMNIESDGYLVPIDSSANPTATEDISIGCEIEATGICVMETEKWSPTNLFPVFGGFMLVLRTVADIHVLSRPSWWTPTRLLAVIASLLAALIAFFVWNRILNHLVERRSRQLFKEQVAHAGTSLKIGERTRLAVELHDSLSQNLAGLACQITAAKSAVMLNGDAADLSRAISNGAVGVQMKDAPTEALLAAIRNVMAGETAIATEFREQCEINLPALTQKQSDILESVARGYTNKDIAKQFGITEVGIRKHLRLVFAKLGAANRSEAVGIALRKHLLKI